MAKGFLTILGMGNQALRILGMANQPLAILGMVTQLITTLAVDKLPRTIATVMRTLCAVTDMNGMTAIGGSNTTS